eukprot:CAMPEP_0194753512 /NCGR_PEP_ID=MMETSP0323_2-20130528/7453_1 /TAXON_ID=2866 ORGANISM="Crypthecodinium cohnii, Strain Seligo" /NCGR_SAMPLE_ID=MMETSP0323_2 /ASSEMBLY_ACC=CAM_ASM_000346 /LENGTH=45 /DNA_ID= /DNA_START= /DNA_END= /DNA_ORIENTATION=
MKACRPSDDRKAVALFIIVVITAATIAPVGDGGDADAGRVQVQVR